MQIGRTNASAGGGCTSDYDIWQQGFATDWNSVWQNASFPTVDRPVKLVHVYYAVEKLYLAGFGAPGAYSNIPQPIAIYNANNKTYRYTTTTVEYNDSITSLGNHYINFLESDFFVNSYDGKKYCSVVYVRPVQFGNYIFRGQLPVVYANNVNYSSYLINLIQEQNASSLYPSLRGVDMDELNGAIRIWETIEHLGYLRTYNNDGQLITYSVSTIFGGNTQVRLFKKIYEDLKVRGNVILPINHTNFQLTLTDEKLADWFYNDFCYNQEDNGYYSFRSSHSFGGTTYVGQINSVDTFKIKPRQLITPYNYTGYAEIPNCVHIEGLFDENQMDSTYQGWHRFPSAMNNLVDFPMWKVENGATTGNLKPFSLDGSAVAANFTFTSTLLDKNKFCEFETINGNVTVKESDPNTFFLNNLPVQSIKPDVVRITFSPSTGEARFRTRFTPAQQTAVQNYINNTKRYLLTW